MSNDKWSDWVKMENVVNKYKGQSVEEIRLDVKKNSYPFAIMMAQIQGDFNYGSVIRSANALGASEVFHYGKRKFDRRSAIGTYHYTDVTYFDSFEKIKQLKEKFSFVALENNIERKTVPLISFDWKTAKPALILLGEEGAGIDNDILDLCDHFIEIPMIGSVRSLNVASAATVVMYDYMSKYIKS